MKGWRAQMKPDTDLGPLTDPRAVADIDPFAVRCTRCQEAWEKDQSRADLGAGRGRAAPSEESA